MPRELRCVHPFKNFRTQKNTVNRTTVRKSPLQQIPGIGPSIAADLNGIGITEVAQLRGQPPQALYEQLCEATGQIHDHCVLYVFRCAVYYASTAKHDPEKLKWWNWKDAPRRFALCDCAGAARTRAYHRETIGESFGLKFQNTENKSQTKHAIEGSN